jgi:hypothetical protein
MGNTIFKMSANYVEVVKDFMQVNNSYYAATEDAGSLKEQIEKDIPRTVVLSRAHKFEAFQQHWRSIDRTKHYTQGNYTAANISRPFVMKNTYAEYTQNAIVKADPEMKNDLLNKFFEGIKDCSFAFIDKNGNDCGLSIAYQKEAPEFFTITFIRHTSKDPKDREVLVFQGTDNHFYPSLENVCGPAYQKGSLLNKGSLKGELLHIKGLPDEVKFFINDTINDKGTLDVNTLTALEKTLNTSNTNSKVIFKTEEMLIKQSLAVYQLFCQNAAEQLAFLAKLPNQDKQFQPRILQLIEKVNETKEKIDGILAPQKDEDPLQGSMLYEAYFAIHKDIISILKQADISKPYQDLINQMDSQYQHVNQSFWDRNKVGLITSSAITVLAVAGIALTATGVLAPLGIALLAALNITLVLASIFSWGLTADNEASFNEDRKNIKADVKKSILGSEIKYKIAKSTLDLYLEEADELDKTPASKMGQTENSFFRKTVKEIEKDEQKRNEKLTHSLH